ncbi:cytochrome P450 [Lentinus tigrinus ALCF2SS1-7]|uniref:cytochrome P450 n=1 Tax=Lentinus tigrinus ALCF2SS1-7 TaxID=1328758 RepID=UPI001165ED4A|nr:cytochrome P450 [Lentinus tigrinus ALCF2SS1-7]
MAQPAMDGTTIAYACLALLAAHLLAKWYMDPLRRIPTVGGPSIPLLSYLAARKFARSSDKVLQEGYDKYQGTAFKVAMPNRWLVVVSGPEGVEDIRRRPESDLSIVDGFNELFQTELILGKDLNENRWHVDVIKSSLTRNLPSILPELLDELPHAVQDNIRCEDGWAAVNILPTMINTVARLSSRVFVGLPLCRTEPYLRLAIRFTAARMKDANIMKLIPPILRPIAVPFLNNSRSALVEARAFMEPLIQARRADMERFGPNWQNRPNDLLQWYLEEATERGTPDEAVPARVFVTNFAAIHTSALSIASALYDLAAHPESVAPLRAEVEQITTSDGWTKAALEKMWKVDSFLRESQRSKTVARFALTRVATKDMTLVDGTFIPRGTLITAAIAPAHRDQKHYQCADVFDPFRFSRAREETGIGATQAFTHTSGKWLAFGHGKHACPGRFFAADELKALLAYMVMNYDVKLDETQQRASTLVDAVRSKILVRKRKAG